MLSSLEILNKAITYKPNVKLNLYRETDRMMGTILVLYITSKLPDAINRGKGEVEIGFRQIRPFDDFNDDGHVLEWVGHCLMEMEMHERDEWFRFNGKMLRNPHATMTIKQPKGEIYGRGPDL